MKSIKFFNTYSNYETDKSSLIYPSIAYIEELRMLKITEKPESYILAYYDVNDIEEEVSLMYRVDGVTSMSISGTPIEVGETYQFSQTGRVEVKINFDPFLDDFTCLFEDCTSLKYVNLTNINWKYVETLESMFQGCTGLLTVSLSFDSSYLKSMASMFKGCTSLTDVSFQDVNAPNLTDMSYMFQGCTSLTSIVVKKLNTESLNTVESLCLDCTALYNFDGIKWEANQLTNCKSTFKNTKVTTIALSWDLDKVQGQNMDEFIVASNCMGLVMKGTAPSVTQYSGWVINTDGGEFMYPQKYYNEYLTLRDYIDRTSKGMWTLTPTA